MGVFNKDDGNLLRKTRNDVPFESTERECTSAETVTHTVTITGLFDDLVGLNLRPGDSPPSCVASVGVGTLYVRDCRTTREDGEIGRMTITCIAAGSATSPYHQTVDIDLAQVEKKLLNHPLLKDAKTQRQILLFEATDPNLQFDSNGNPQCSYDLESGKYKKTPEALSDAWAIKYAKAKRIGVDTYSVYLPVVTRVSNYIKMPGLNVSGDGSVSGTLNPSGLDMIGQFDRPPVSVSGFSGGQWFKNGDHFVQNGNGSWTRTESWVYTNDLRTKWIYDNGAALEVVQSEE